MGFWVRNITKLKDSISKSKGDFVVLQGRMQEGFRMLVVKRVSYFNLDIGISLEMCILQHKTLVIFFSEAKENNMAVSVLSYTEQQSNEGN